MSDDRRIYASLLEKEVADHSYMELERCFSEICSGLTLFGNLDNWTEWFHYLLPRTIPRAFERHVDYLIEPIVTAFMAVFPESEIQGRYEGFSSDALLTLGRKIMSPEQWPEGPQESTGCLHTAAVTSTGAPFWSEASGDFSASMFFCLKYLPAEEIPSWTRSVFSIPCPRWRAQVLVWLSGAKDLVDGKIAQPSELDDRRSPSVKWNWSLAICGRNLAYAEMKNGASKAIEFLPKENCAAFSRTISEMLTEDLISEWLESLMQNERIFDHVTGMLIPERLRQQYQL